MYIHIRKDGAEHGPYSLDAIREAIANGSIDPHQPARSSQGGDWRPLESLLSLDAAPLHSTPTASPPSPLPESDAINAPTSLLAKCSLAVAAIGFIGMWVTGGSLAGKTASPQLHGCFAWCFSAAFVTFAVATALNGLRAVTNHLRETEKRGEIALTDAIHKAQKIEN
jgi:hypothetical protein